jgi:uncharacterized protein YbaA (DUF1428 family)
MGSGMRPAGVGVKIDRRKPSEDTMAGDFDDHAAVLVLEFLVKRLVLAQCLKTDDPEASLAKWSGAMEAEEDMIARFAFSTRASRDASLNAIEGSAEFKRLREEIAADFRASREASPLHPI